jgi:hypothetical protein
VIYLNEIKIQVKLTVSDVSFKLFYFGNHSQLDTRLYKISFSQGPLLSPPKILTFPPKSLCILKLHFFYSRRLRARTGWAGCKNKELDEE